MEKKYEYGRHLLLEAYKSFIEKYDLPRNLNVSLVGGSDEEPELEVLKELGYEINLTKYGIEYYDIFCDLNNKINEKKIDVDLLICANVLEHIWNIENFFENIKNLTNKETLVYINCPKSNMEHGSPEYYSAGYAKEFLIKNLEFKDFNILEAEEVGTERYYKSIHLLQAWYTKKEVEAKYRFKENSFSYKLKHLMKLYNLGHYLSLSRASNDDHDSAFMTNSYIFATK
tara:strand:- start:64 stop:750 length:687 start_codon:yes stop_codon:yes gene_type:complete